MMLLQNPSVLEMEIQSRVAEIDKAYRNPAMGRVKLNRQSARQVRVSLVRPVSAVRRAVVRLASARA